MPLHLETITAYLHCPFKAWQTAREITGDKENFTGNNITLSVEKIASKDKLAVAAWMMATQAGITVHLKQYAAKAEKLLQEVTTSIHKEEPPALYKNKHCAECPFWQGCYKKLVEKDCLSLLAGMTPKVLSKYHSRGIFSITQLSHLFRPRRRDRQLANTKYLWELKALAIREQKTFILQAPEQELPEMQVFIDFEGIPEEQYIYLIGVLICENGKPPLAHSFWADTKASEEAVYRNLFDILKKYPEAIIYHYSSYETKHLKKASAAAFTQLEKRMVNLLSFFRTHVYPPTYGNGLKEIAGFLGFRWQDSAANGLQSIAWRKQWEQTRLPAWKERLLQYNLDDCKAMVAVYNWLKQLAINTLPDETRQVSQMKKHTPYKLQANAEYNEDFTYINKAAYFDYQRAKVYWRDKRKSPVKKALSEKQEERHRGKGKDGWQSKKINEIVIAPPRTECPTCGHTRIYQASKYRSWVQTDLKFTATGIRQHVTEYRASMGKCAACRRSHSNDVVRRPRFGDNLFAWVTNLYVTYHISNAMVSRLLEEQFGIWVSPLYFVNYKRRWWKQWQPEAEYIKQTVLCSPVLHIDETPVKLVKEKGYVWAFATSHTVYYHLSLTREAAFLHDWLKDYKGVIVTDFFPAYDVLPVKRQKCLIHLIRDLNDDLFKNPFDEAFKQLVTAFGKLLKKIIETVDKYGLKKARLQKHAKDTAAFYSQWVEKPGNGELSLKYSKRLKKHWPELWVFLEHDNVPWNNNNAEVAIKAFAQYRRGVNGQVNDKGLADYLQMLGIAQTCRYRDVPFLDMLRMKKGLWENVDKEAMPGILPFRQARLFSRALKIQSRQDWD